MTRIVFMGSPEEVVSPLRLLAEDGPRHGLEIVAVVSQPARPVGRGGKVADPPVAVFAKEKGIRCLQPERARDPEFLSELRSLKPDIIVTAAYGQILSDEFLSIPSVATINIHPSLLPKYRGATPVPAVLLDGLDKTAVTILFTVKKLDAGNIILQRDFTIASDETAGQLTQRLFAASGPMLLEVLTALLANPHLKGDPQDDTKATFCRKIDKDMGAINWNLSAQDIVNRFRAFEPWPGTWGEFQNRRVAVTAMKLHAAEGEGSGCGKAYFDRGLKALVVGCGRGFVAIFRLKPAGGKEMDAASFWNGVKDKQTACFVAAPAPAQVNS
jgi:methionyl-tRNA formyltransferase